MSDTDTMNVYGLRQGRGSSERALKRRNWNRVQGGGPPAWEAIRHHCLCRKYRPEETNPQQVSVRWNGVCWHGVTDPGPRGFFLGGSSFRIHQPGKPRLFASSSIHSPGTETYFRRGLWPTNGISFIAHHGSGEYSNHFAESTCPVPGTGLARPASRDSLTPREKGSEKSEPFFAYADGSGAANVQGTHTASTIPLGSRGQCSLIE